MRLGQRCVDEAGDDLAQAVALGRGDRGRQVLGKAFERVDDHIADLIGFGHDRHGAGGSMNATLRFGFGYALHAVSA